MLLLVLIGSVILRVLVGQWGVSGWSWIGPTGTRTITLVASGSSRTSVIIIIVNIMISWSSVSRCHCRCGRGGTLCPTVIVIEYAGRVSQATSMRLDNIHCGRL